MIVKCLKPADALRILEARSDGDELTTSRLTYEMGSGEPLREDSILDAQTALQSLQAGFPPHPGLTQAAIFDSLACIALHQHLSLDAPAAGNPDFWTWLAVEHFPDLVEWRHGREGQTAHFDNYGIGGRWENLLARLWFRAELSYDSNDRDPYHLARRGSIDFWQSGIIRKRYSSCRHLTRALIRLQYPSANSNNPRLHPMDQRGVRLLYKRIRRLQATVAFEYLDDEQASDLLESLASDLRNA